MHRLLSVLVICTVLSVGCALVTTPAPGYHPGLFVTMRSTGGFCDRCGDELQIDGNGNANYERWSGGAIQEKKTAKITPQQIEDLVGAITRPNVLSQE